MKVLFVLGAVLAATQPAIASGSLDYLCAAEKSNVRYEYHNGDGDVNASVYRAVAIDVRKAYKAIVAENQLSLDAFQVADLIKRGASIDVPHACDKIYGGPSDFADCMKQPDAVALESSEGVVDGSYNRKIYRISQSFTMKDGSKVALVMENYDSKVSDGDFHGTLTVTSARPGFKDLTTALSVNCTVSTP